MSAWHYPGPQRRGQENKQCAEPRWVKLEWKSLAWATQLLAALDLFLVVFVKTPVFGDVLWYCVLAMTAVLFVLVSVLAVRR
jgi:hypothetical protein